LSGDADILSPPLVPISHCDGVRARLLQGTATGPVELSTSQRPLLEAEQERDMAERYGKLVGKRKLMASLLVARLDTGEVAGCVGVEVAVADRFSGEVLPRCVCRPLTSNRAHSPAH